MTDLLDDSDAIGNAPAWAVLIAASDGSIVHHLGGRYDLDVVDSETMAVMVAANRAGRVLGTLKPSRTENYDYDDSAIWAAIDWGHLADRRITGLGSAAVMAGHEATVSDGIIA